MNIFKHFLSALLTLCCSAIVHAQESSAVPGEYIIRYKNKAPGFQQFGKTYLQHNMNLKKTWPKLNLHHFKISGNDLNAQATLKNLREDPDVLFAEPNYYVKASDIAYFMTGAPIRAPESWNLATPNGPGVSTPVVAVLDSGVDITHSIFDGTGRLWENAAEIDGIAGFDDDNNGLVDDFHGWNYINNNNNLSDSSGHGTHVAGIVVGSTEDIVNISGPEKLQVMVLKFLDAEGIGTTSAAINSIYYAVDNGAKVLNNSWGGSGYSQALHQAITYSYYQGTVFVAAAGNSGTDNDISPTFPASYDVPNVISVGASTDGDNIANFSNFGEETVDLLAPGVNIISAVRGGGFGVLSGTSMSTPFVAGLAAMVVREAPQFSGFQVKEEILGSVDTTSGANSTTLTRGRVAFENTVGNAQANKSAPTFQPDYDPDYSYFSRTFASTDATAVGCGRVKDVYKNKFDIKDERSISDIGLAKKIVFMLLFLIPFIAALVAKVLARKKQKRQFLRAKVSLSGDLCFQGMNIPVNIDDISAGGAGVSAKDTSLLKMFSGEGNDLTLKVYTDNKKYAYYPCKIVRNIKGHLGLKF